MIQDFLTNGNVQAFLQTIRWSEGTSEADGYNYLFGSSPHNTLRFSNYSKHPNNLQTHNGISSTAAGAYQILFKTWQIIQNLLKLPDFSPHSQDIAAIDLISGQDSLMLIVNGHFTEAIQRCSTIWASFPGNDYNQPEHKIAALKAVYTANKGIVID